MRVSIFVVLMLLAVSQGFGENPDLTLPAGEKRVITGSTSWDTVGLSAGSKLTVKGPFKAGDVLLGTSYKIYPKTGLSSPYALGVIFNPNGLVYSNSGISINAFNPVFTFPAGAVSVTSGNINTGVTSISSGTLGLSNSYTADVRISQVSGSSYTLAGSNTYTGVTSISSGALVVSNSYSAATSISKVSGSGYTLAGSNASGAVDLNINSTSPTFSAAETLTVAGTLAFTPSVVQNSVTTLSELPKGLTLMKAAVESAPAIAVFNATVDADSLSLAGNSQVILLKASKIPDVALTGSSVLTVANKLNSKRVSAIDQARLLVLGKLKTDTLVAEGTSFLLIQKKVSADRVLIGGSASVELNGTLRASDGVTLSSGTLAGSGTIAGGLKQQSGKLTPTSKNHPLKIQGDWNQTKNISNSYYPFFSYYGTTPNDVSIQLSPKRSKPYVKVGGQARLGDYLTLNTPKSAKFSDGDKFKILEAKGGIKNHFVGVNDSVSGYEFRQEIKGNDLFVVAKEERTRIVTDTNSASAEYTLSLSNMRMAQFENQLIGFALGTESGTLENEDGDSRWTVFASGQGVFAEAPYETGGTFEYNAGGATIGAGYRPNDDLLLGVYAGYLGTLGSEFNYDDNSAHFGFFGVYHPLDRFYVYGAVGGATHDYNFGNNHNDDGLEFNSLLGGGLDLQLGPICWGPFASLQYSYLTVNNTREFPAFFFPTGPSTYRFVTPDSNTLHTTLGLNAALPFNAFGRYRVTPSIRAAWQNESLDFPESYFLGAAGVSVAITGWLTASAYYTARTVEEGGYLQGVQLGIGCSW